MNNTYLAITIGPIYKTILQARKTREIWIASYLFSLIMKDIVSELMDKGNIILPAIPDEENGSLMGAGVYPDRLIMTLNDNPLDIALFQDKLFSKLNFTTGINRQYLENFVQIYHVLITQDELEKFILKDKKGKTVNSFIHKLNHLLDIQELKAKYNPTPEAFFKDLFDDQIRKKFYETAFKSKKKRFPSILEISAKNSELSEEKLELLYKDDPDLTEQMQIEDIILNLPKHEKYIAILNADGDNMGKVVSAISGDASQVSSFSKKLTDFSQKAAGLIVGYGGTIIYIGGDDILCFAPIVNKESNIFNLIKDLNDKFKEVFSDELYKKNDVSLSYGLSLTYYKYPLNEALDLSKKLLFENAKNTPGKNCTVFQLLQHSGQYRETVLNFGEGKSFDSFLTMLNSFSKKEQLLQSLTHKLVEDKEMFLSISGSIDRINGYFENHFSHNDKEEQVHNFITAVKNNLISAFGNFRETPELALQQMNTICRILKFMS